MIILVGMLTLFLQAGEVIPPRACPATHLDLNTASKAELLKLEGVTPELADALIKNRPYKALSDARWLMGIETREKVMPKLCVEEKKGDDPTAPTPVRVPIRHPRQIAR